MIQVLRVLPVLTSVTQENIRTVSRHYRNRVLYFDDRVISFAISRFENLSTVIRRHCLRMGFPNPTFKTTSCGLSVVALKASNADRCAGFTVSADPPRKRMRRLSPA